MLFKGRVGLIVLDYLYMLLSESGLNAYFYAGQLQNTRSIVMPNTYPGYFFSNIRSRPYVLLGFAGFVAGIWLFIPFRSDIMDINMHGTYYIVTGMPFYKFFAAVLLFLWSIYLIADRLLLSYRLTLFHVLSTLVPLIFFYNNP